MKTCKECDRELEENMFGTSKGRNGELYPRNTCKECMNAKRRKNPTPNKPKTIIITENKTENKIDKEFNMVKTNFTDREILEVVLNKDKRIHTVFNLDKDIRDKLKELSNDKKLNMSDVANLIFKKFFDE